MVQAVQTLLTLTKPVEQVRTGMVQTLDPTKHLKHEVPTKTYSVLQVKATVVDEQVAALAGHKTQTDEINEYPVVQAEATVAEVQVVAPVAQAEQEAEAATLPLAATLTKKNPELQVEATVGEVQVATLVPQAVQVAVAATFPLAATLTK